MSHKEDLSKRMTELILSRWDIDAIYLYGSRGKGTALPESDWDLGLLFSEYQKDPLDRHMMRAQDVQAYLERELKMYEKISVVDLEAVSPPLQFNIINGKRLFLRHRSHIIRIENSIISKIEKDYDGA